MRRLEAGPSGGEAPTTAPSLWSRWGNPAAGAVAVPRAQRAPKEHGGPSRSLPGRQADVHRRTERSAALHRL
jgi:hypothetical protein